MHHIGRVILYCTVLYRTVPDSTLISSQKRKPLPYRTESYHPHLNLSSSSIPFHLFFSSPLLFLPAHYSTLTYSAYSTPIISSLHPSLPLILSLLLLSPSFGLPDISGLSSFLLLPPTANSLFSSDESPLLSAIGQAQFPSFLPARPSRLRNGGSGLDRWELDGLTAVVQPPAHPVIQHPSLPCA